MAELSWWSFMVFGMLPLPIVLITVLSSPAPRDVRKGVLWFVEQVLSFELRRPFQIMHGAIIATGMSLAASIAKAVALGREVEDLRTERDPNIMALLLGKKFRAERNMWISAFCFAAWVMLLMTHKVNKVKHELRGQLLALQGKGPEAAEEVVFLGVKRQQEMCKLGARASDQAQLAGTGAGAAMKLDPAGAEGEGKKEL